jgi:hypothetical protein
MLNLMRIILQVLARALEKKTKEVTAISKKNTIMVPILQYKY